MKIQQGALMLGLFFLIGVAAPIHAEEAPAVEPTVLHIPPSSVQAGSEQTLKAVISGDWRLKEVWVALRAKGSEEWKTIPFKRDTDTTFAARISGKHFQPPGVEYYIASKASPDGPVRFHFATDAAPHPVVVQGETSETQMADKLARHNGRRSSFKVDGELTLYGRRLHLDESGDTPTDTFSDAFWTSEVEYTYRLLGTLYDIRFGLGLMRGERATATVEGVPIEIDLPQGVEQPSPGLNYGWSEANFEFHRNLSVGARLILGASEDGFAAGVGGIVRIGRITGTHFAVGGQALQDAGNLGFMRFAWDTVPRVPMSLTIEVSERPDANANPPGVRLIYDLGWQITEGFTLGARVGYAARTRGIEGGPVLGLSSVYEF